MKNHVQPGKTITLTAPYAVTSGDGLLAGSVFGVAAGTAALSEAVETALVGAYDLKKVASQARGTTSAQSSAPKHTPHGSVRSPFASQRRVTPFWRLLVDPGRSQSDNARHSSSRTTRPVQVFGWPFAARPCR